MLNFPKEFLQTIGSIVVNSAILEDILMTAISELMFSTDSRSITRLVATDSFDTLLSKYKKLVIYLLDSKALYDKKLKQEIKNLCDGLYDINERRNLIIHSLWLVDKQGKIKHAKYKRHIKEDPNILDSRELTWEIVKAFPDDITELMKKLLSFNKKIIKLLSP